MPRLRINMNRAVLRKTLARYTGDASTARQIAALFTYTLDVPRKLRDPLRALAATCLACEVHEASITQAPSFPDLYRRREKAFIAFADAVVASTKRNSRKTEQPQSFPVTDPEIDAPDGAVVDGYERSGDRWKLVDNKA
jgi:hypothetical protein